ncbi:hypothetical protein EV655_101169 [Rhodovulum euryhalinum]|uniref:Uncharacterized protein n=2 Tax=Rhodovulum euryhalinum TaxID=35805 RepID=A0A4R2KMX1_9RHOB|nr:hypothetical protein EV655_101169 [Rhodovulum euryhalinum]
MGGLDRLNSKLAKLKGADAEDDQIVTGATEGIIAALLAEIEETILPRDMVLTNERGEQALLVVVGRRVVHLEAPGGPVSGVADAEDDPAARLIAAFTGPFRTFLDQAREISIDAMRPHHRVDPTEIGCSVETLAAAITAVGTDEAAEIDPVTAGLGHAVAGLRLAGGEIVARTGDPALVTRLEGLAGGGAAGLGQVAAGGASCTLLGPAGDGGLILVRIEARGEAALILAPAAARAGLIALCRTAVPSADRS